MAALSVLLHFVIAKKHLSTSSIAPSLGDQTVTTEVRQLPRDDTVLGQ